MLVRQCYFSINSIKLFGEFLLRKDLFILRNVFFFFKMGNDLFEMAKNNILQKRNHNITQPSVAIKISNIQAMLYLNHQK